MYLYLKGKQVKVMHKVIITNKMKLVRLLAQIHQNVVKLIKTNIGPLIELFKLNFRNLISYDKLM